MVSVINMLKRVLMPTTSSSPASLNTPCSTISEDVNPVSSHTTTYVYLLNNKIDFGDKEHWGASMIYILALERKVERTVTVIKNNMVILYV
jgi:hypothetical protein